MLQEIRNLIRKELLIEWKQKYAFNGLLLYVLCMVVVISLAFKGNLNPLTWNIVYWIIILFVAINAVAKSFMGERQGQLLYQYTLANPAAIIIAKLVYNMILLCLVALICLYSYGFLSGIKIADWPLMLSIVLLGCATLSANLTLVTAIAAKAENRATLLAVLSFPLLVPVLLILIRLSRYAVEGKEGGLLIENSYDQLIMIGGMSVVLWVLSVILFPFVWRD
ncbi:MAG: heme exporter protein CcmB [Bacteroidia bacterium]|nr:heme exporter protein CcmB [Bacteroidia bacterium]